MRSIFIGYIFIIMGFSLDIEIGTMDLLPNFIGYFFMMKGFYELEKESIHFSKMRPFAKWIGTFQMIEYIIHILGISLELGEISTWLPVVKSVVLLYIIYNTIGGIVDIENSRSVDLNSDLLRGIWNFMIIFQFVLFISLVVHMFVEICIIITALTFLIYLITFNKTKQLYEALPRGE